MRGEQVRISGEAWGVYLEKHFFPTILVILSVHASFRITGLGHHAECFLEKNNYLCLHAGKLLTVEEQGCVTEIDSKFKSCRQSDKEQKE